jgi:hypothetical protein
MNAEATAPQSARVLINIGGALFIGLGIALAVVSWTQAEPRLQLETLPGAVALGAIVALPGLVAVIALRRNDPRLLWPAIVTGLLPAVVTILSVGLVLVIPVLLLVQAALRWPSAKKSRSWRNDLAPLAIPALAIVAGLTFFAHQDPACWDYSEDPQGRVTYTRTGTHAGMDSGWFAGGGTVTGLVVDSNAGEGTGSLCVSDRITPLEAAVALTLIGGAGSIAWRISGNSGIESSGPV